ncbi:MAG: hypothetical protein ACFB00_03280 [Parvularculaceae bacterium]
MGADARMHDDAGRRRSAPSTLRVDPKDLDSPDGVANVVSAIYQTARYGTPLVVSAPAAAGARAALDAEIDAGGIVRDGAAARALRAGSAKESAARLAAVCEMVGLDASLALDGPPPSKAVGGVRIEASLSDDDVAPAPSPGEPSRVAVAGLGVVGEGLARRLLAAPERFELVGALIGDPSKPRWRQLDPSLFTTQTEKLLASRPDVVVGALSCGDTGARLTEAALARGISVVTANKQAIAHRMAEFAAAAERANASFSYAASVGGGAPMVETVRRLRAEGGASAVARIDAVVNGTVNYILSEMQDGAAFETALAAAQAAGFAEADPSADLSGADADAKVRILAFEAGAREIAAIDIEPLDEARARAIANAGGVWRQLAEVEIDDDAVARARVRYADVAEMRDRPETALFAGLSGEGNALVVTLADGRRASCRGRGAGRRPTVEAVLADLVDAGERR